MPRAEMLRRMDSKELSEWMAFYQIEPFGGDTGYIGHAITASTIANANRAKGHKPHKVEDFMPQFGKREQTVDQQIRMAAMLTTALGGIDARNEDDE